MYVKNIVAIIHVTLTVAPTIVKYRLHHEVQVSTQFTHRWPEAWGCVNRVETWLSDVNDLYHGTQRRVNKYLLTYKVVNKWFIDLLYCNLIDQNVTTMVQNSLYTWMSLNTACFVWFLLIIWFVVCISHVYMEINTACELYSIEH